MSDLHKPLLAWYDKHRRTLPWREEPSPYRTWISEIMLQQTQVATVLPYYGRFLRRFPDIETLARAREEEVLKLWAGLGYYSRARNLHRAAKVIAEKFKGRFPDTFDGIIDLPGVGRYTAGAILSIAFSKPFPLLDGNVARVFSRLFGIKDNVKSGPTAERLWELAEDQVHESRPGDWNQALMELGALVCAPESPHCGRCPLTAFCVARKKGIQETLPNTGTKKAPVELAWKCLWIERKRKVLLWKRDDSERFLPGHWSIPEYRHLKPAAKSAAGPPIARIKHTITHHKITVDIHGAALAGGNLSPNARWIPRQKLKDYLISSVWLKAERKIKL